MKLKKNDRINYNDCIYSVVAVIWSTVYLQKIGDCNPNYSYTMEEVQKYYKDIEFMKEES